MKWWAMSAIASANTDPAVLMPNRSSEAKCSARRSTAGPLRRAAVVGWQAVHCSTSGASAARTPQVVQVRHTAPSLVVARAALDTVGKTASSVQRADLVGKQGRAESAKMTPAPAVYFWSGSLRGHAHNSGLDERSGPDRPRLASPTLVRRPAALAAECIGVRGHGQVSERHRRRVARDRRGRRYRLLLTGDLHLRLGRPTELARVRVEVHHLDHPHPHAVLIAGLVVRLLDPVAVDQLVHAEEQRAIREHEVERHRDLHGTRDHHSTLLTSHPNDRLTC